MRKLISKFWVPEPEVPRRSRITIPSERVAHIFAIGDIHGRLDLLSAVEHRILERAQEIGQPALVVCLGDFIDRGPNSRGVIERLTKKMRPPLFRVNVCGNHDDAFLRFLLDEQFDPGWLGLGGDRTLESYGIDVFSLLNADPSGQRLKQIARDAVPPAHVDFLQNLPITISIGKLLFVHAGVVPGVPLAQQSDFDLMWIREPFLSEGPRLDLTVIHGHTPSTMVQFGANRVGVDTGAYATGKLSAVHIGPHGITEL
jgi:serine/threonine protein phosphatase 1